MKTAPFNRWFMLAMIIIACALLVTLFAVQMFMNGNGNNEAFAQCNPIVMSSLNTSLKDVTDDIDTSSINGRTLCGSYIVSPNRIYALSIIKTEGTWEIWKWILNATTGKIERGTPVLIIPATPQMTSVRIALENGRALVKSMPDEKIIFKFNGSNVKALSITNAGEIVTLNKDIDNNAKNIPVDSIIEQTPTDTLFVGESINKESSLKSLDGKYSLKFTTNEENPNENIIVIQSSSGVIKSYLYRTTASLKDTYLRIVDKEGVFSLNLYSQKSQVPISMLAGISSSTTGMRLQLQNDGALWWRSDSSKFFRLQSLLIALKPYWNICKGMPIFNEQKTEKIYHALLMYTTIT